MSFNRLPRWLSLTACRLFPRRYCCRQWPFIHECGCRTRKPVRLQVDRLDARESPTALFGPSVASSLGISLGSLVASEASSFSTGTTWHSPESPSPVGRISNPSHETSVLSAPSVVGELSAVRGSHDPAPATTAGLPQQTSTPSDSCAAFTSSDLFPDPLALDPVLLPEMIAVFGE
jgi:hypothetical protein